MTPIITDHGEERAEERIGLSKGSIGRMAEKAFIAGIKHGDVNGQLKKYMDKLYLKYKQANNLRIYGEFVYLFCGNRLVTVLNLPHHLCKIVNKMRKQKESNATIRL